MFLQSFRIDKFGGRYNWQFDGLRDGVEVFHGPDGSGKSTIQRFLRSVLFGFDHSLQRHVSLDDVDRCGGSLTFQTAHGIQTVRRHNDGTVDGHLTVEDSHGRVAGQQQLDSLLAGTTSDRFDQLFAVDFAARPDVDRLLAHARAAGVNLARTTAASKVGELQGRLDQLQKEFSALPASHDTLEELNRRQRELSAAITAHDSHTAQYNEGSRIRLVETRQRVELQLADARNRLVQLEQDREAILARKRQFPPRDASHEQGSLALELDGRIEQWRQLLTEISENKRGVQDDLARHDGAAARAANPRQPLKDLEQRIQKFESRMTDLDHGECVCRPLQTELRHTITEIKQELHSLCLELARWESAREYRTYSHQMQHLNRCESELQVMVQSLLDSRAAMADPRNERWCQCDSHPVVTVLDRDRYRRQMLLELEAELSGVEQLCQEAKVKISGLEAELAELLRRTSHYSDSYERDLDYRPESAATELESIRTAIAIAERRERIAAEIATLKLEVKDDNQWGTQPSVVAAASRLLRVFSGEALHSLELDAHDQVWVVDRVSRRLAWHELSAGGRDQVYLALLLAIQPFIARTGVRLPLLLKDAFSNFEAEHVAAAADILLESVGQQVLILTRHQHVAEVFRQLHCSIHELADFGDDVPLTTSRSTRQRNAASQRSVELTEASAIDDAPSISGVIAEQFRRIGVSTVGQLLNVDPATTARKLRASGVVAADVETWQAQALLMCRVPHLRAYDARILVACDVTDPRELRAISPKRLRDIVQRFATSRSGRTLLMSGTEYELSRVTDWMSPRSENDDEDELLTRRLERSAERKTRHSRSHARHENGSRGSSGSQNGKRGSSERRSRGRSDDRSGGSQGREQRSSDRTLKLQQESGWKFYLNNDDPIVDAPSIGPRTAQRLEAIGIETVRDFLQADSDEVAEKLGLKRITGELVRQWQQQTTLATRIPQLRGHDAQILVALGIVEPAELAESDPDDLWKKVKPFVKTNQGKRIIRNGKQPDFEEVTSWIQFAAAARPLKAA